MKRLLRSPLALVALAVFIDFAGFGLVIPILPFWAERLGANAFGVGLVVTVYALAQFLFTPVLGALSDRHGRRPIILVSLLIEALAFALTALTGTLPLLLIARVIGGTGASNLGSAQAVVADITPPERRARGMGAIGAAIGLGFVIGPAAGGLLATLGPAVPFWCAMGVALANALLVFRFLPETHTRTASGSPDDAPRRGLAALLGGWHYAARYPVVARLAAVNFLFTLAFSGMETVFALFTQHTFTWSARQAETANGYFFTYVGVLVVVMQGGLIGRLVKRYGERTLLLAGLALLVVGLALLPLGTSIGVLLIALGIVSIAEGAITPTTTALLSFASPPGTQGATLGLSQGLGGLGRVLGPLVAGSLFTLHTGLPFLVSAALVAGALVVALPARFAPHAIEQGAAISAGQMAAIGAKPNGPVEPARRSSSTAAAVEDGILSRPARHRPAAFSHRARSSMTHLARAHLARTPSPEYISRVRPTGTAAIRRTSTNPATPARYSNES